MRYQHIELNYFLICTSLEEVKKKYKELAFKFHPDKGGDTAIMQAINIEYAFVVKNKKFASNKTEQEQEQEKESALKYPEIINKIVMLDGLIIEIVGDWIWLSGETYKHKTILKELNFLFASKKKMWYYRPEEHNRKGNTKPLTIDEIRAKFGSETVSTKSLKQLQSA